MLQRVSSASVRVDDTVIGCIERGLLVFLGVERGDSEKQAQQLAERVLSYRIFPDQQGRMNQNLLQIQGQILVVSQFTLCADTQSGLRPSFTPAASAGLANALYEQFISKCRESGLQVATGLFAADMQVSLVNDGPVTFLLEG